MIWVEYYAPGAWRYWAPGWWAECDDCDWTVDPCHTQQGAAAEADAHALAMGEITPDELDGQ